MNSIIGFTQRVLKTTGDSLNEQNRDALETVDRNAAHLLGLINDILDLSKIEAGRMDLNRSSVDLLGIITDVAQQTAPLTDNRPIELVLDLPDHEVQLKVDRVKLMQVVTNLISNGIKYTEQGTVTVKLRETRDAEFGRAVRIDVIDTGIGIRPEDIERLFKKFSQVDGDSTRQVTGTGLGLCIAAKYVEMHGGRIDVESTYGRGSTFSVFLPLAAEPIDGPRQRLSLEDALAR